MTTLRTLQNEVNELKAARAEDVQRIAKLEQRVQELSNPSLAEAIAVLSTPIRSRRSIKLRADAAPPETQ